MLTSFWGNLSAYAAPTAAQNATATTPAAFAAWPSAVQASFLKANGSGTPPSLVIGPANDQVLAQLGVDGASVTTTAVPQDFATATSKLTLAQFSAWADPIQVLYVRANGGTALGSGSGAFSAEVSADGTSVATTGGAAMSAANLAALTTAPESMTAATLFALPDDEQALYLQTFADASGALAIGNASASADDPAVPLRAGGRSFAVTVPAASYPGFNDPVTASGTSGVAGFESWPEPVQIAYLQARAAAQPGLASGGAIAIWFPNSGTLPGLAARLGAAGTGLSLSATPDHFTTDAHAVTLDSFLAWPLASQTVFIEANLGPSGQMALSTSTGQAATIQRGTGIDFTVTPSASVLTLAPADLDPILFGLLSTADQTSYFAAHASGQPPALTLSSGSRRLLVTQSASSGLSEAPYPAAFDTSPATLDASTFLSWDPVFRQLYVAKSGSGSPPSVIIGSGNDAVSVVLPSVNGTTVTSISPIPYYYMPGAASGVTSPINDQTAGLLFPILDGSGGAHDVTPLPTDFGTSPTALSGAEFTGWDTAVQLQYLRAHQAAGQTLAIGTGTDRVDAFIQTTATAGAVPKVYIVQNLQKQDIGSMSFADQKILAASAAFSGGSPSLAQGLGLIPDYQGATAPTGATAPLTVAGVAPGAIGGDTPDPNAGLNTQADLSAVTLSAFGYVQQMFVTALNTVAYPAQVSPTALPAGNMAAADLKVFQDEIDLLRRQTFGDPLPASFGQQTTGQAILSPKDIQDKLTAILTRFKRANAFSASSQQANGYYELTSLETYESGADNPAGDETYSGSGLSGYINYWNGSNASFKPNYPTTYQGQTVTISPDASVAAATRTVAAGNTVFSAKELHVKQEVFVWHPYPTRPDAGSISQGYQTFMTQEKAILDLANRADQLAGSGTLADTHQSLDVPNMVYLFQLFANLTGEAVLRADTEEVNQTNELLNEYAVMQKIINQTVAKIPPQNGSSDTPTLNLQGSNPDGSFTDAEQAIVAMFNNQYIQAGGASGTPASNPIELLNGVTRPLSKFSSDNSLTAQSWSSIGTSLSDAVTQLNQASQLKMNDINADTKQKDRQFDLANTALQKAADAVSKIASAA